MENVTLYTGLFVKNRMVDSVGKTVDVFDLPKRWRSFEVLERDYSYLSLLHERLLGCLSDELNRIHKVDHSVRYWRILAGPWLDYITTIFFDRWMTLKETQSHFKTVSFFYLRLSDEVESLTTMEDFSEKMISEEWNCYVYSICAKDIFQDCHFGAVDVEKKNLFSSQTRNECSVIEHFKKLVKACVHSILDRLCAFGSRKRKFFFHSTYLRMIDQIKLGLSFRQFPQFYKYVYPPSVSRSKELRSSFGLKGFVPTNEFEIFLSRTLMRQLPSSLGEGYGEVIGRLDSLNYPRSPIVLFSSSILWNNTLAMAYVAEKTESGAKLVYGQHGGYGVPRFMRDEDHERRSADRFLTWGWTDCAPNAWPVGLIKATLCGFKRTAKPSRLLLVRGLWSPYPFRVDSGSGLDLNCSINDSIVFAQKLPPRIRNDALLVRLYFKDYGYRESELWTRECPDAEIAKIGVPIRRLLKVTKLAVYTYNVGTGWIEYLAAGIPVIIFWDMQSSPIRRDSESFFQLLRRVGIFHDSPESAARHVSEVWDDVESWWNSSDVRAARDQFLAKYANVNMDVVCEIRKNILQVINS